MDCLCTSVSVVHFPPPASLTLILPTRVLRCMCVSLLFPILRLNLPTSMLCCACVHHRTVIFLAYRPRVSISMSHMLSQMVEFSTVSLITNSEPDLASVALSYDVRTRRMEPFLEIHE
jgi:hypothetical protein